MAEKARRSTLSGRKNRAGESREDFFGDRKPGEQSKAQRIAAQVKINISGCSAVGSALALGVPWRYPGLSKSKRRKAL